MIDLNWNSNHIPNTATQYPTASQYNRATQYPTASQYNGATQYPTSQYPAAQGQMAQQTPTRQPTRPPMQQGPAPETYQQMLNGADGIEDELGGMPQGNGGYTQDNIEMLENPMTVQEANQTSWKTLLAQNLGRYVLVSFLMGTQQTVVAEGVLYEIGNDYIVLYQPVRDSYITADLYSVKFVEFRAADNQQRYDISRRNG